MEAVIWVLLKIGLLLFICVGAVSGLFISWLYIRDWLKKK